MSSTFRWLLPVAVGSLLGACGSEFDDFGHPGSGGITVDEGDCLSCGEEGEEEEGGETFQAQYSLISATPEVLTFFSDTGSQPGAAAKPLTIFNETGKPTEIIEMVIVEHPDFVGRGDTEYFRVQNDNPFSTLNPFEEMIVDVEFLGSLEQRNALLYIYTTHPNFPELMVDIAGRNFVGDPDW